MCLKMVCHLMLPRVVSVVGMLWVFSTNIGWAAEGETLTINSGSSAPMIINDNKGFYPDLVHETFRRLKINVRTLHMPSSSSLKSVVDGLHDGLIARIGGVHKKKPNLIPVREKVMDLNFTAYSNDKNIKIASWDDLRNYNVAYIRGWKIYDKKVKNYKSLVKVKSPGQLFNLLRRNRTDVVLYQETPARYLMNKMNYFPHEHTPHLDSREMFIYMHKRHSSLVPRIEKVLREMKKDGTYQRIYNKNIIEVISNIKK